MPDISKIILNQIEYEIKDEGAREQIEATLSSANAYTDSQRLGYTEPQKVLFEKATRDGEYNGASMWGEYVEIKEGVTYNIHFDNTSHVAVGKKITIDNITGVYMGNLSLMNDELGVEFENSGESFGILYSDIDGCMVLDYDGGQSVSIEIPETIHQIDQKYLPVNEKTLELAKEYSDSKGGYTKTTKTVVKIIEELKLSLEDGQVGFSYPLIDGETYEVILDGEIYVCKAFPVEFEGQSGVVLGNASPLGCADTGEPFCIAPGVIAILAELGTGGTSEHSFVFSKVEETKTIVPFDPKYLPEGGVGYTEMKTAPVTKTLTFDGNIDENEVFEWDNGRVFVKISETPIDVNSVTDVVIDGTTYDKKRFTVVDVGADMENPAIKIYALILYGSVVAFSVIEDAGVFGMSSGLWVGYSEREYVSEVKYKAEGNVEIVHKIDPKYLPEASLPETSEETLALAKEYTDESLSKIKEYTDESLSKIKEYTDSQRIAFIETEAVTKTICEEENVVDFRDGYFDNGGNAYDLTPGKFYIITVNENSYKCKCLVKNDLDETVYYILCDDCCIEYEVAYDNSCIYDFNSSIETLDYFSIKKIVSDEVVSKIDPKYLPDEMVLSKITMSDEEGRRYKVFIKDGVLAAMPEDGLCAICGRELLWDSGKRRYACLSEINTGYCDYCHEPLDEKHYCEACCLHTCPECGCVTEDLHDRCKHCGYVFVEGTCSRCGLSSDDGYDAANEYCPDCDGGDGSDDDDVVCAECGEPLDESGYCTSCGTCSVCGNHKDECTCGTTTCPICGGAIENPEGIENGEDIFCSNCDWGTDSYSNCPECGLTTFGEVTCARCGYTYEE